MRFIFSSFFVMSLSLCACSKGAPKECRSQCELAGSCEERGFDDYPDYDGTLDEWDLPGGCEGYVFAISGQCAEGPRFLRVGNGHTNELRYFDDEGAFLGLTTGTDVATEPCWGYSYWPETVLCEKATVTEAFCGETWVAGDTIELPYADGINPKNW